MTAKEYLGQAYHLDKQIQLDMLRLEAMKSKVYGRSVSYNADGSGRSLGGQNKVEAAYIRVADFRNKIIDEIVDMMAKKIEIDNVISSVSDLTLREILIRRYLKFQKWEEIAEEMNYSRRRVTQLHGQALKNISLNFPFIRDTM